MVRIIIAVSQVQYLLLVFLVLISCIFLTFSFNVELHHGDYIVIITANYMWYSFVLLAFWNYSCGMVSVILRISFFFDSVAAPRTVRRQMVLTDCYRLYSLETILNIILSRELSIILNGFVAMHIIFREVWIRWVIFNFVTRGFRLILLIPLRWLTRWMLWEKTIFFI